MKQFICLALALWSCLAFAAKQPVYHYDFAKDTDVVLENGAVRGKDYIRFNGKNSRAVIPGSEKFNLTEKGITFTCVVRFDDREIIGQDMISKGESLLFSRNDAGAMFCGFQNLKGQWLLNSSGMKVEPWTWVHYAMTISYSNESGRGDRNYTVSSFLNGEKVAAQKFNDVDPVQEQNTPLVLGYGKGHKLWAMKGDMAEVSVFDQALSDGEIEDLALNNPRLNLKRKDRHPIAEPLAAELSALEKNAVSPEGKWLLSAMRRAARNGADQQSLQSLLRQKKAVFQFRDSNELQNVWNKDQQVCRMMLTDEMAALVMIDGKGTLFPLAGLYDRRAGKEMLSSYGLYWAVDYRKGKGRLETALNYDDNVSWTADCSGNSAAVHWKHPLFEAEAKLDLRGKRLETSLDVRSTSKDHLVFQVSYPCVILALKDTPQDQYIHMTGELVGNPSVNGLRNTPSSGYYPNGHVPMQFCAYYDKESGTYFSFEDPKAINKRFTFKGQKRGIELAWMSWAPYEVGQTGLNRYEFSGKGVIEAFRGDWYDAAHIYRRFLKNKAFWWCEIPRKNMSPWFAENTLWILAKLNYRNAAEAETLKDHLLYLRNYFELPFGSHVYFWEDLGIGARFTHFFPASYSLPFFQFLNEHGIGVKPYTNVQLWATLDGPYEKTDWMYSSHGKKYAIKNFNGSLNYERYRTLDEKSTMPWAVMCPACPEWQKKQIANAERFVSYGAKAIYYDEMLAAGPYCCFDESHGHKMNDPAMWLQDGYLPMMRSILKKVPSYVGHDTEGFEEPLVGLQDGFLCWGPPSTTPLSKTVFGPRMELIGRLFSYVWQFNEQTEQRFYSIIGRQFACAEQLGWFETREIVDYPEMLLYTKQLMHLKNGLRKYFREGELMRPLKWEKAPGKYTYLHESGKYITVDRVFSGAYICRDGLGIVLLVNPMLQTEKIQPLVQYPGKVFALCEMNAEKPRILPNDGNCSPELSFRPLEVKFLLTGSENDEKFQAEANRVQQLLNKVARFRKPDQAVENFGKLGRLPSRQVADGQQITAGFLRNITGALPAKDNSFISWFRWNYALLDYGMLDFGEKSYSRVEISYGVGEGEIGGTLELRFGEAGIPYAVVPLKYTEGQKVTVTVPLRFDVTGRRRVSIRFPKAKSCTFYGWRLLS